MLVLGVRKVGRRRGGGRRGRAICAVVLLATWIEPKTCEVMVSGVAPFVYLAPENRSSAAVLPAVPHDTVCEAPAVVPKIVAAPLVVAPLPTAESNASITDDSPPLAPTASFGAFVGAMTSSARIGKLHRGHEGRDGTVAFLRGGLRDGRHRETESSERRDLLAAELERALSERVGVEIGGVDREHPRVVLGAGPLVLGQRDVYLVVGRGSRVEVRVDLHQQLVAGRRHDLRKTAVDVDRRDRRLRSDPVMTASIVRVPIGGIYGEIGWFRLGRVSNVER